MTGLQARRRDRLISFHAGNNRSNQSFFQIVNRFDCTHSSRAQLWRYRKDKDQTNSIAVLFPFRRRSSSQLRC
jgi:hypothetical protein